MPTATPPVPPPALPAADPERSYGVYPFPHMEPGGRAWTDLRIVTESLATGAAESRARADGVAALRRLLLQARDGFFATGEGKLLRDKEERLRDAERAAADSIKAINDLRAQWKIAVAADSADDVAGLELQIDHHETALNRLKAKVPVLREDVERTCGETALKLYHRLVALKDEFEERAEANLAAAKARLAAAVNAHFIEWVTADAELAGCHQVNTDHMLQRYASASASVPTRKEAKANPAVLPKLPPAPTRPRPAVAFEGPPLALGFGKVLPPDGGEPTAPLEVVQTEYGTMLRLPDGSLVDPPRGPRTPAQERRQLSGMAADSDD